MSESQPSNPERIVTREEVISLIKEKGLASEEAREAYSSWCALEEVNVTDPRSQQELELRKAELFIEAGEADYAYDEILDPMRQNGAEFFEQHPDLKKRFDSFYE